MTVRMTILKTPRALLSWTLPIPTFLPNFLVSVLNRSNHTTNPIVEIIKDSKDKRIYATQFNATLNDFPHKTVGVSTAIDKVDTVKFPEDNLDSFHKLDTLPNLLVPLVLMMDDDAKTRSMTKKPPISMLPSLDPPQLMVFIAQHKSHSHPVSQRSVSTTNYIPMGHIRTAPCISWSVRATTMITHPL
jgi:hypothetical protein